MSLWKVVFDDDGIWRGVPAWEPAKPTIRPQDIDRMQRALALHPNVSPEFNLQPTIDMLEIADMYGFKVTRS